MSCPKGPAFVSMKPLQWTSYMTLEWAQNLDLCLENGVQICFGPLHCLGLESLLCFGGLKIQNQILFHFDILFNQKG